MSREAVESFYEHLKSDKSMQEAARQARMMLVHLAKSHGHDFTLEELQEFLAQKWGADFEADNPDPDSPQTCFCI
jgi:predicted ribosomally synthesized peptide with nif11-like leader